LREPVPLKVMSPNLIAATIATEDPSFYDNPGVNLNGLLAAVRSNLPQPIGEGFGNGRGGSSITQQLVKNLYISPEDRFDRKIKRKVKETVLAVELKRRYTDDQILEWYLNQIFYGNFAYGVEASAQRYFGKQAKDLTLAEAAMLAGIPSAPSLYSPVIAGNEQRAIDRQHQVLDLMLEHRDSIRGIVDIAPEQIAAAKQEQLAYRPPAFPISAPHFVVYVQDIITKMCKKGLFDPPGDIDCEGAVARGGLRITTTLDLDLQHIAEKTVEDAVASNEERYGGHNGGLVAVRPQSGEILAMVGSRDYFRQDIAGNVNVTTSSRSHGSTMKMFTYVTGFESGWAPSSVAQDAPLVLDNKAINNWNFAYLGRITVRKAIAESVNTAAVRSVMELGEDKVTNTAHRLGITDLRTDDCGPTITLGSCEVKLLDMAYAYSVLANNGVMKGIPTVEDLPEGFRQLDPASVLRIQDADGKILYEFKPEGKPVVKSASAYMFTDILSKDAINWSRLTIDRPAAAKTGTSEEFRDNVVIGYTPDLAVGAWVGNSDGTPMAQGAFSASGAGPMWKQFMIAAHQFLGLPPREFQPPDDVIFAPCRGRTEVFARDVQVSKPGVCKPPTGGRTVPADTPAAPNSPGSSHPQREKHQTGQAKEKQNGRGTGR
ncbi:MAG: transglycosylase domain-containing protein, partial [Dehalococcoidia bacterium]|nr:transglycosylase domain-containing protein [Dehalococcoidia bacterium]